VRWIGVVTPLALLALAAFFAGWGPAWELQVGELAGEPWRLVTGHLVHWSADHLAWDWLVFVGLGWMAERQLGRRRVAVALGVAAVAISLGAPMLTPELSVYRGLSGLDAALFALLAARSLSSPRPAARWVGTVALVGLGGKVVWEIATGAPLFIDGVDGVFVVPAAHLIGGWVGMMSGGLPRLGVANRGVEGLDILFHR
jgi:rhomboid family GlyGly-CTERM serine protease